MRTSKNKFIVVGLGEILWDILPDCKKLGGAPTNFAYHAHCLGAKGCVVSCVGKDDLGVEIIECLDQLEINRDFVSVDNDHSTGTVTVELNDRGTPDYIIHENVAWDFIPSSKDLFEFASNIDAVCFGSLCQRSKVSRDTIRNFLRATKKECICVFDINIRQQYFSKAIINTMLDFSNVFKLNDEELPLVAELLDINGNESEILEKLINRFNLKMIVLTKGSNGSLLFGDDQESIIHSEPVDIVDTVGAGDAFTAAVVMGMLQNKPLRIIHELANRLAGFVCSQKGATPRLPKELMVTD